MIEHQEESKILLRLDQVQPHHSTNLNENHHHDDDDDFLSFTQRHHQSYQRTRRRKRFKPSCEFNNNEYLGNSNDPLVHYTSAKQAIKLCQTICRSSKMGSRKNTTNCPMKLLQSTTMLLAFLLLSPFIVYGNQATSDMKQPIAEALRSSGENNNNNNKAESTNVILIKYANVTKTDPEINNNNSPDDTILNSEHQLQLNEFKLYEPLSVSIIESKFSHSIQLFDVSSNHLSTLPKDLLCPLSHEVRQLNISHNLLENFDCLGLISQAGQLCLSELKVLDMSFNLIKHLPATGVATLHNLEILNLSNNLIESLDELSLSSLSKLTKLDLSSNRIQQLPQRIFQKSTSMQVLKLNSNQIQTIISREILFGLISLEELNLSHNNISQVSDSPFLDKINLTRVDLTHNQLSGLKQDALRVTSVKQQFSFTPTSSNLRPRLHHNGQYAGVAPSKQQPQQQHSYSQTVVQAEFYLSSNPFICDCQLEWLRKFQPTHGNKRTLFAANQRLHHEPTTLLSLQEQHPDSLSAQLLQLTSAPASSSIYNNNDQPSVILASPQNSNNNNNISEIISITNNNSARPVGTLLTSSSGAQQQQQHHYGRVGDLEYVKCSPLFQRNNQRHHHHSHHHNERQHQVTTSSSSTSSYHRNSQSRSVAPPNESQHNYAHHYHSTNPLVGRQNLDSSTMIDLLTADSSNFLCRYKSHCFALCHCCEFDACDCEMICPTGCNCYYNLTWQTNIIDCSSSNHTVVPDRIPMDVSGLYLDGNNIESLKPSNLIARGKLKTLYLNSSNLQYIANRTFNGLIELQTLYLHDNLLRTLNGYEFEPLAQLKALYLQSNRLDHISNQTFIYLRSLEILDLSSNRLTSTSVDLFWSIGHHNIRLRQLSIAHNWWSCQCSSINRFRQILKQKFLLNGSVNIPDKNQLRCYYNSTTVGPLILAESESSSSVGGSGIALAQQPLFASFGAVGSNNVARQQTQLTEINQCSELIAEDSSLEMVDLNPPFIHTVTDNPASQSQSSSFSNNDNQNDAAYFNQQQQQQQQQQNQDPYNNNNQGTILDQSIQYTPPSLIIQPSDVLNNPYNFAGQNGGQSRVQPGSGGGRVQTNGTGMPLTSFILLSVTLVGVMIIAVSIFVFIRQQQRHFHQNHHKKSSAASTTSASSSASSTAISSLNGAKSSSSGGARNMQHPGVGHTMHHPQLHHHHLIMSNGGSGPTTTTTAAAGTISNHLFGQNHPHHPQATLHHHSASSQSNIYAALVSPTNGNSTTVTTSNNNQNNSNNLYSNSSTTASHHSSSSHGVPQNWPHNLNQHQHQHSVYSQPSYNGMSAIENHYILSGAGSTSTGGPYKVGNGVMSASLYNTPQSNCYESAFVTQHQHQQQQQANSDWIKLPKVKQFMSKLVNKSLALGGYRSCSRDELSAITSDKIYDAFISYDKRDEAFVMQHLSAELEYGQPQYRIADRYRDLPLPSSTYIAEAISSVIGCSHRTLIVLTENYLASDWCRYELQTALHESSLDKSHKIIAIVLDPKCLLEMDNEMRALLTSNSNSISIYQSVSAPAAANNSNTLVQLDGGTSSTNEQQQQQMQQQQLIATLTNQSGGNQQVCTQTAQLATNKITFINYNEPRFWSKIKQLMPMPRPTTQTLTLTTKN